MDSKIKGNIAMSVSKAFSGLNQNALKYLLPVWMNAYAGVALRLCFGSLFFWCWGAFRRRGTSHCSLRDKVVLIVTGMICVFGYMFALLQGLTYTTPVSSSIFLSIEPVWVYVICLIIRTERLAWRKVCGIVLGLSGAFVCIFTQRHSDVASDPMSGNLFCLSSSVLYAVYLVVEKRFLKRLDNATVSKWTFLGGAAMALIVAVVCGWHAPVLHQGLFSVPMMVLAFVLVFPTSLSYLLLDIGLKNLSATVVALYGYVILIVATVASYILGQDHFSWWQMLAIGMMVVSVYLVEIAEIKK